jgi:PAS domain S-box-containing protein
LYLEDNESDAELIVSKLKSDGFIFQVNLVSNQRDFTEKLIAESFDLILSDYNLPAYSGMDALRLAQEVSPQVPFICVSGAIGEDLAVEMLKEGAVDYVLKDKLGKLSLAIRRALNEVNERRGRDLAEKEYRKLSQAVENSPTSISITNAEGVYEYVNPRFLELTGYTKHEIIGAKPSILKSGMTPPEVYRELWGTILTGNVWRGELINKTKGGDFYWVRKSISSIADTSGKITHFIAVGEDITSIKKNEEELIKAKERAIESDMLKSNFLANMSHEIRTPLNSIIGFSELLGDPDFNEEQKAEFIQTIVQNGNNLLSVISDIIDISKLDSGQVNIRKHDFPVSRLLNDIYKDFFFRAKNKGIGLRVVHPLDAEVLKLESDEDRLRQVLTNLIGNAVKFTDTGYIEISYYVKNNDVVFRVKDTGIGIPHESQKKIFERFRQVEEGFTRKYGGNGLGLAITKNLVELLGGTIWVNSEPGQGSSFYFTLPLHPLEVDHFDGGEMDGKYQE